MTRRAWVGIGGGVLLLAGAVLLWDLAIETDEERLEALVEDVRGPIDRAGVQRARARWVELERQPVEINALGQTVLYRDGELEALDERVDQGLRALYGSTIRVMSYDIEVTDDDATVSMRLLSDRQGMATAQWELVRHGDDWLLARVLLRR